MCDKLELDERDCFGLRFVDVDEQVHWLSGEKTLRRQLARCGSADSPLSPFIFYFCVKFYVADPCRELQQERTRYQFFLQLKQDISHGRLPVVGAEALAELCAYAVQC